ncbi:MAG: transposase [bacterium]
MPRSRRLNLPGCIYHVMSRGIEKRKIFRDNFDCTEFLDRLSSGIKETGCQCLAWVLMPNHFHLLIRTGKDSLTDLMRKLLTGYAIYFNRRHKRQGYLYQNRYKSILCQEDKYLLELVRYIHLNPLRANIVKSVLELNNYQWSGHSVLIGGSKKDWQETGEILGIFNKKRKIAINRYVEFINDGIGVGKREDLTGGGLRRSAGGWEGVELLKRDKIFWRGDERMLGDADFVDEVLKAHEEELKEGERLKQKGWNLEKIVKEVCGQLGVNRKDLKNKSRNNKLALAKQLISYYAYIGLKISGAELLKLFNIKRSSLSVLIKKGKIYAEKNNYKLIN